MRRFNPQANPAKPHQGPNIRFISKKQLPAKTGSCFFDLLDSSGCQSLSENDSTLNFYAKQPHKIFFEMRFSHSSITLRRKNEVPRNPFPAATSPRRFRLRYFSKSISMVEKTKDTPIETST